MENKSFSNMSLNASSIINQIDERARLIDLEIKYKNQESGLKEVEIRHQMEIESFRQQNEALLRQCAMATEEKKHIAARLSLKEEECIHYKATMEELEKIKTLQMASSLKTQELQDAVENQPYQKLLSENLEQIKQNNELQKIIEDLQLENGTLKSREKTLQESIAIYEAQVESMKVACSSIEQISAENMKLMRELESDRENREYNAALKHKLETLKELEAINQQVMRENKEHKENQENVRLLKEERALFEFRAAAVDEIRESLAKTIVERDELKGKVEELERRLLAEFPSPSSPNSSMNTTPQNAWAKHCNRLRRENTILSNECSELRSQINDLQHRETKLESKLVEMQREISKKDNCLQEALRNVEILQRRFLIKEKECQVFRESLDKYDELFFQECSSSPPNGSGTQMEKELRAQVQRLTGLVDSQNAALQSLKAIGNFQSSSRTSLSGPMGNVQHIDKGITCSLEHPLTLELRERIAELERENEQIQIECNDLKLHLDNLASMGVVDLDNIQVIHFERNPSAQNMASHQETVESLKEDKKKLRTRCIVLEEKINYLKTALDHSVSMADVTSVVASKASSLPADDPSVEIARLNMKLKSKEAQKGRLVDAFEKASADFRNAMKTLLGFHLNSFGNGVYDVSSIFVGDPRMESFRFKIRDNETSLIETAYSRNFQEDIKIYFGDHHSVPALLANVQKKLFEEQTLI